MMQWSQLLNPGRLCRPDLGDSAGRPAYLQDYDRILFSEPFRRLAQKTQVHPLYDHDHVHHRMIHSMETASVGRSLGQLVGQGLVDRGLLPEGEQARLAGTVQAACLLHDIGNPPFGHAGEDSIGSWFAARFAAGTGVIGAVDPKHHAELSAFEGNAQGFRIAARLEMARREGGMRLSYATLGAFAKYPCTAPARAAAPYVGLKKFGVFASEAELFAQAARALGMVEEVTAGQIWWRRHPLAFLVEAADDICYRILDLEDAATVGDLRHSEVVELLEQIAGKPNRAPDPAQRRSEYIGFLRASAIHAAIDAAVDAFFQNYDAIMAGQFNSGLIDVSAKGEAFQALGRISNAEIFTARRKTELELVGHQVLHQLLDHFAGLFDALAAAQWDQDNLPGQWAKWCRCVEIDLREVHDPHAAAHALGDFISGMTDRYALKIRDMVMGRP